ncbi:MAG: Lipoprotein signal peptidase [Candidatus Moranbacteria bacterium GW2011_GWC2_37_73]|nr:MAG: Lipoprotein signal peptidase [Parcubacteria group bacterium GW2011_GWC1_36_108]KKQ00223.1 MAG: Lipoprotein signal peptidase [Candidatus Moranbacteria bacterium GW2011_GWD1_36_198]KKQ00334.1 MAG: Lipoprotein signal peptidase [Candidatus Moranbacteria bacterium GW2011_GWD2_36_198]KKQ39269.1 MAG: Lipoprotein signal peptidase [Candidatus Moranbacteria bacterium GW2011_GWC2_37_73]HAR99602.1 hypothetical protein [Candidatus Moranbacteria bacterium]
MQNKKPYLKPFFVLSLLFFGVGMIIFLDQLVKYKIRQIGGFYICNSGISFGLNLHPVLFWSFLSLFILSTLFYLLYITQKGNLSTIQSLSFVLLIGGALSNGLDRAFFGCVIDFITILKPLFPLFNLADLFIFIGSFLLFVLVLLKKDSSSV